MKILITLIYSLQDCPAHGCFSSPKTKFVHMSFSLISSPVSPSLAILRHRPSILLSLDLTFLRVTSGSHSSILLVNLLPGILFACSNPRNSFSSIASNINCLKTVVTILITYLRNNLITQGRKSRRIAQQRWCR